MENELSGRALEILRFIRDSKGRGWSELEKEFVQERGWAKQTFVKYWQQVKPFLEKVPNPANPGRFLYIVKKEYISKPEIVELAQRPLQDYTLNLPRNVLNTYLEMIGKIIRENVYGNPFKAWDLIENLAMATPNTFKKRFKPYLDASRKTFNEKMEFEDPLNKLIFVKRKIVPFLLDKFCSFLFQAEAVSNE